MKQSNGLLTLVLVVAAVACIVIPAWQLLEFGPFSWHVQQPEYWQGGIEALVVIGLVAAFQLLPRPAFRIGATLLLAEIYLRRHAVDLPVLVDLVYFEIAIALGAAVMRLIQGRRPANVVDYLTCFVLGFCVWSACAWTTSAIGWGSLHDLRWLTFLLLVPALATRSRPWLQFVHERVAGMPAATRACAGALLGWMLVLFARAGVVFSYDALWYGLRGEYVLLGAGSVYAPQGLVAPAYYVPKLYELFLIPLSGFGSSSVLIGITLLVATLLAAAMYELLAMLGVREKAWRFAIASICLTLPAIANAALEPKPDILAAFLLIFAWIKAAQFVTGADRAALLWALGLALLSTQVKLTAIPYAGALLVAMAIAYLLRRAPRTPTTQAPLAWTGFALILFVSMMVMARTWLLTGLPTIGPAPLVKLWQALGFQLKPPAGSLDANVPQNWSDLPALVTDLLFRPQRLGHIVVTWTGNVWLWLGLAALSIGIFQRARTSASGFANIPPAVLWPGAGLALTSILLVLGWGFLERGGDGNYFIAALVALILITGVLAFNATQACVRGAIFAAVLGGFCAFQAAYSFASSAWTSGTRAMDFSFNRGVRNLRQNEQPVLRYYGISDVAAYLHAQSRAPRAVGYVDDEPALRLPAAFEGLLDVTYSRPELVNDRVQFLKYIADYHIDFLIMPHEHKTNATIYISPTIAELAQELAQDSRVIAIKDAGYDLYDLSALPGHRRAIDR